MDPRGPDMPWITPCLTVDDSKSSIAFYQEAFGFALAHSHVEDGRIMHAGMSKDGQVVVMFAPEGGGGCTAKTPRHLGIECPFSLYLYVEDVDALHDRAVAAGARSLLAPADMFWGDRFCTVEDPDGYRWHFARHLGRQCAGPDQG